MKHISITVILLGLIEIIYAQNFDFWLQQECEIKYDQPYGEFERNKFDIILPKITSSYGLVIYIHGGGFKHGDKKAIYNRKEDIRYFIENDIAVASINYRFYNSDDSVGVKVCLEDVKSAIQFIRHNSEFYNIDKNRIGCYGESAGAGSSLFIAFHDDMCNQNDTTLLGESTRIKCAGAIATQSTYDVFKWKKIIPWMRLLTIMKRSTFYNGAANFYGYKDYKSFKSRKAEITESLDMLEMIDANDPPVYLINLLSETFPKNDNVIQHHKKHAIVVSKKLNKYGVENHLYTNNSASSKVDIDFTLREFMVKHLK